MLKTQPSDSKPPPLAKDWTKGSIISNLLRLSWPMVLMESLYVLSQVVDMIWIGQLGSAAIAGVGVANLVLMLVMSMDFGLIMGVRAMIARFFGAGQQSGANRVTGQAFLMGICWGALIMGIGFSLSHWMMQFFGVESIVVAQGAAYLRIMFIGWIPLVLLVMGLYAIQSSGDTVTPLKIEILIRVVHIILCPFLVLGWWSAPQMGVGGAALSNVIAHCLGMVVILVLLLRGHGRLQLTRSDFRPDPSLIWRILKIGVPALVMSFQRAFGNLVLTWLIAPFGTTAVAAHSLAARVEMFLLMPGMGFAQGTGVLVGQNLGAQQPERAEKSAWTATWILEAVMLVFSVLILIWARSVISIFTSDTELVAMGALFLRIATAGYIFTAFVSVMQSSITGAGDTVPNMVISIILIWIIQLPLAYLLAWHTSLGVYGLRWAIVFYNAVGALAFVLYFRTGRWKTKVI